jgi:preflagellin peptidase FlaK
MEIFYPLVLSAIAVLVTLTYASYLDIRDRRVPFVYWLPMLGIGIICVVYLLWQTTANLSLISGYLAIVFCFLYADYLDSRGRTDSPGLTWYYQNSLIFYYLALVLALPVLSWFILAPSVNIQLVPWYGMYAGVLSYVTYKEYKGVPDENVSPKQQKK